MYAFFVTKFLIQKADKNDTSHAFIGMEGGTIKFHNIEDFQRMVDNEHQRPKEQWWLDLRPVAQLLAQPRPSWQKES